MVDISPKALRFARLAAEHQVAFANDPQIEIIKREEESFRLRNTRSRVGQYVEIPEDTADFCMRAVRALLDEPARFQSAEWDGNDFVFMQAFTESLREQLIRSNAQAH